jgi:hypothetical protein
MRKLLRERSTFWIARWLVTHFQTLDTRLLPARQIFLMQFTLKCKKFTLLSSISLLRLSNCCRRGSHTASGFWRRTRVSTSSASFSASLAGTSPCSQSICAARHFCDRPNPVIFPDLAQGTPALFRPRVDNTRFDSDHFPCPIFPNLQWTWQEVPCHVSSQQPACRLATTRAIH